MFKFVKVKS